MKNLNHKSEAIRAVKWQLATLKHPKDWNWRIEWDRYAVDYYYDSTRITSAWVGFLKHKWLPIEAHVFFSYTMKNIGGVVGVYIPNDNIALNGRNFASVLKRIKKQISKNLKEYEDSIKANEERINKIREKCCLINMEI